MVVTQCDISICLAGEVHKNNNKKKKKKKKKGKEYQHHYIPRMTEEREQSV
jgi:hypothetical protein